MGKIAAAIGLFIVLIVVGTRVYAFFVQERELNSELTDIQSQLTKAQANETDLQNEVQYLANPLNLEKELRAQFNYKKPGETMIIIVPTQTSTATSSSL